MLQAQRNKLLEEYQLIKMYGGRKGEINTVQRGINALDKAIHMEFLNGKRSMLKGVQRRKK